MDEIQSLFLYNRDIMAFSFYLALLYCVALTIAGIWPWIWAWLDDSKKVGPNRVFQFVASLWGLKRRGPGDYERWDEEKGRWDPSSLDEGYRDVAVFIITPILIALSGVLVIFYPITLFIITMILLAHTARFIRRQKKVLDAHMADKKAHE